MRGSNDKARVLPVVLSLMALIFIVVMVLYILL